MQILSFDQKLKNNVMNCYIDDDCFYYHSWRNNVVIAFGTLSSFIYCHRESNPQPSYHFASVHTTTIPVCYLDDKLSKFCYLWRRLIIDQILRKRFFSKIVAVFRKYLSVSRWNLPGYFSVLFRFLQVTEFGKSTAIYLADSFCQLYSSL